VTIDMTGQTQDVSEGCEDLYAEYEELNPNITIVSVPQSSDRIGVPPDR
jgi:hypothetical protein